MSPPLRARLRNTAYAWIRRSVISRTALVETTHGPSAFSQALSMARWAIPPAYISTISRGEAIPGPPERRPARGAIRCSQAAAWREREPEDACGGLHGTVFLAMARALAGRLALIAAPAEGLSLCLLQGC